jgi:predicted ATPase/transcriptional regulator with XRE-family HTH domain/Tfp pilus assembly protein PilF
MGDLHAALRAPEPGTPATANFHDWLRQRRKELGIAQEELADRVGVSFAMLRKLESGERRPSGQVAALLADFFRIPADEREAFVTFARTGGSAPTAHSPSFGRTSPHAPWRGARLRHTNLPAVLTQIIGRDHELQSAVDHLLNPRIRLLSMIGPPGVGKTRLAVQVASHLADEFEDGVFFIDLASVVDPDLLSAAMAAALGLAEVRNRPVAELLQDHVRDRRMLLVLDNFEQLLDAAASVVRLLEASPWLKVLVTSREALHVRGERRFSISPLELPDLAHLPPVETLAGNPSVALFVERAHAVAPDFALTAENAADVARVCVGLEGLPLAIELTAARARHLTPQEMRHALVSRFNLPAGGGRDLPPRQRTLKSAIDWSYGLLDRQGQEMFRRLSVFAGGFTPAAARAVGGGNPAGAQAALESLADKNLLREERLGGERRFGMLEAIREYAREQMDMHGETTATQQRHAEVFLALAEQAATAPAGEGEASLARLETEHDNLRSALEWLLQAAEVEPQPPVHDLEMALRMLIALTEFWKARSYYGEWRRWADRAVEVVGSEPRRADPDLDPRRAARLSSLRARLLYETGWLMTRQGDYLLARGHLVSAADAWRELEDKGRLAFALHTLALATSEMGEKEGAKSLYEESLALQRETGATTLTGSTLNNLGILYRGAGEPEMARQLLEQRLALAREQNDLRGMATALDNLGLVAIDLGDFDAASRYQGQALPIFRQLGSKRDIAEALSFIGMREVEEGSYAAAWSTYTESLTLFLELEVKIGIAKCLSGLACIYARTGRPLDAARLWGAIEALRAAIGAPLPEATRPRVERHMAAARAQVEPEPFEAAWAGGRAMPLTGAIASVLGT